MKDNASLEIKNNIRILEGCYRKLKSYYYYNKNFIVVKKNISEFEYNSRKMKESFSNLAQYLAAPQTKTDYINNLCKKISFFIFPKKFKKIQAGDNLVVSNDIPEKKLDSVNYFIDLPIELMILDVLWTLKIEKYANDKAKNNSSFHIYGNRIHPSLFWERNDINYETRRFFEPYFENYLNWRNSAFKTMDNLFKEGSGKSSVLFSLDIKSFFYSIRVNKKFFDKHTPSTEKSVRILNNLFSRIYQIYFDQINKIANKNFSDSKGFALPIGLFSSMSFANIYLENFDKDVIKSQKLAYYGRYVDDLLLVYEAADNEKKDNMDWINSILVKEDLLKKKNKQIYSLSKYPNLFIQSEKIKVIYISKNKSRFLLDYYDSHFKVLPSFLDALPIDINIKEFEKNAFSYGRFNDSAKPRELEHMQINSFHLSVFFSKLCRKYSKVKEINDRNIEVFTTKIDSFFEGNTIIEYYNLWQPYFYFLLFVKRAKIKSFYYKVLNQINKIHFEGNKEIDQYLVKTMTSFLNVCLTQTLSIDYSIVEKYDDLKKYKLDVQKYIEANLFDHSLIALPLSNFFDYRRAPSFKEMTLNIFFNNVKLPSKLSSFFSKKIKWNPRFLHFFEIQLINFYLELSSTQRGCNNYQIIWNYFRRVNFTSGSSTISWRLDPSQININSEKYRIEHISIFPEKDPPPQIMFIVGNAKFKEDDVHPFADDENSTERSESFFCNIRKYKDLRCILKSALPYKKEDMPKIMVLSELFLPFNWIPLIFSYVAKNDIAIITGLQYIKDSNNHHRNLILSAYPYNSHGFKGVFFFYREKNDYSPDEKYYFKEHKEIIRDIKDSKYQIVSWNGLDISSMICYELTDISARAIMKGRCDILTASVFNKDTPYFSSIIESSVRDLHACLVQTNTSQYGDSRVSLPFNRDNRDLIKIKGGINAGAIIETLNFSTITNYQKEYNPYEKKESIVKKPSARFKNKRISNSLDFKK